MSRYHHAAHTLDPTVEIPDQAAPAAGHDADAAGAVKERADEHREAVAAEARAAGKVADAWRERDPKPTPSELLGERGEPRERPRRTARKKDDS